jgi:hypothetical protein
MRKNVFVVGLDAVNLRVMSSMPRSAELNLIELLSYDEVKNRRHFPLAAMADKAVALLRDYQGPVDGIVGFWDFPVTSITPYAARELGLPSPSLESAMACIHKALSRQKQKEVLPEMTPDFARLDPFAKDPTDGLDLEYPFWLKPLKSYSSYLGFRINDQADLEHALEEMRAKVHTLADPFNEFLLHAGFSRDLVEGGFCLAEEIISCADQCTLCGWVAHGAVHVYGIVDNIRMPDSTSFARFQYPSRLPLEVRSRMTEAAARIMTHIGYDQGAFNIEFYHDPETGRIWILEINPRMSQSLAYQFNQVDGAPNHAIAVDLALGRTPDHPVGRGPYRVAAKCYVRRRKDGVVRRVPGPEDLAALRDEMLEAVPHVEVAPGQRLSDLAMQDSYSYVLGYVYLAADSQSALLEKFERAERLLGFRVQDAQQGGA